MKSRLVYLLALLFVLTSVPLTADEYRPEPAARSKKSYRKYSKSKSKRWKKKRRTVRRYSYSKKKSYSKAKRQKVAARKRVRPRSKSIARSRSAKRSKKITRAASAPPRSTTRQLKPKTTTASTALAITPARVDTVRPPQVTVVRKGTSSTPRTDQAVRSDRQSSSVARANLEKMWRGIVRHSIAQTAAGRVAPVEEFPSLAALMRTLPDEGEIRVRYGIYANGKTYGPKERIEPEQRNVRVACWLYAARLDTANGAGGQDIQLLLGTSNDTSRARYMIAEAPGPIPGLPDTGLLQQARDQLLALVPSHELSPRFRRMTPREVVVEGSLFFNGIRTDSAPDDPSGETLVPSTVWEIHPVTAVASR